MYSERKNHGPDSVGHAASRTRKGVSSLRMGTGQRWASEDELITIERRALAGLDLVVNTLDRALEALSEQDSELAELVRVDDDQIDDLYLEIHQALLTMLARQPPQDSDLRMVAALLHVIRCVERMGDQCVNVAKVVPAFRDAQPIDREVVEAIKLMGQLVRDEVIHARDAFASRDADLALTLLHEDERINRLNRDIFRRAVEIGDNALVREWAMFMILVARALERIGDNAVDIAEQTMFVVTGEFREFSDASTPGEPPRSV
jgi:phosphate transport system protein